MAMMHLILHNGARVMLSRWALALSMALKQSVRLLLPLAPKLLMERRAWAPRL